MPDDAPLTLADLTERVEAISALHARKFGIERDGDWFALKLTEEVADVLAHLLLLVPSQGVDVDAAVRRKWLAWAADLPAGPGADGAGSVRS